MLITNRNFKKFVVRLTYMQVTITKYDKMAKKTYSTCNRGRFKSKPSHGKVYATSGIPLKRKLEIINAVY